MALSALGGVTSPQQSADGALACLGGFSPRTIPERIPTEGGIDIDLKPLAHDPQTMMKIMRRRERERDRNSLLLTPRLRQVGLDIAALNSQVATKRMVADAALHEDDGFDRAMEIKAKLCDRVEASLQQELKSKRLACIEHSLQHLRKDQRREYHLSDPHALKKESPAGGKECGLSSAQRFEGEDMQNPETLREKRREMNSWLLAQMAERKLREEVERDEERALDAEAIRTNNIRAMCEQADLEELREQKLAEAAENRQMAAQHSARRQRALQRDADQTRVHMDNAIAHNLERERHDTTKTSNGQICDHKRCTLKEEQDMWDVNKKMVLEQRAKRRSEGKDDATYHQIGIAYAMISESAQSIWDHRNDTWRKQINEENKVAAQEKREREAKEKRHYRSFSQEPP